MKALDPAGVEHVSSRRSGEELGSPRDVTLRTAGCSGFATVNRGLVSLISLYRVPDIFR